MDFWHDGDGEENKFLVSSSAMADQGELFQPKLFKALLDVLAGF